MLLFCRPSFSTFFSWTLWSFPQTSFLVSSSKIYRKVNFLFAASERIYSCNVCCPHSCILCDCFSHYYSWFDLAPLHVFLKIFTLGFLTAILCGMASSTMLAFSKIPTAGVYEATEQDMKCFPSFVFRFTYLHSKQAAVCVRPSNKWEDFTIPLFGLIAHNNKGTNASNSFFRSDPAI